MLRTQPREAQEQAAQKRGISEDSIRAAIALVLDGLPERKWKSGEKRLVRFVAKMYEHAELDPPEWIRAILGG